MILTVTLNPALDVTYETDSLRRHGTHRVATVAEHAGGKGVNVARVLHTLGAPVRATGLAGGATGAHLRDLLGNAGIAEAFLPIAADTRRTVVVTDPAGATGFWEPGPRVGAQEWAAFQAHYAGLLDGVKVVVLSGSLPAGVPADAYATLLSIAHAAGAATILDTDGEPLRNALRQRPGLVKPNTEELHSATGLAVDTPAAAHAAASALRALGARDVVASLGAAGLIGLYGTRTGQAKLPHPLTGNPTGAGDACVAALALGELSDQPWPARLADAVALSAAAVLAPVAGTIAPEQFQRLRSQVQQADLDPTAGGGEQSPDRPGAPCAAR
ncbi:1-phosphofructokinase family hexose kinase [Catellatospora sp. NPDC049609]|uniref:1-phosphofructokinase family hexose kinase n=1 Tax=Catellatospora sp. NPDC049609 TaxID=3155505 RepID=UPI00343FA539